MLTDGDIRSLSEAVLKLYAPDLRACNWVEHAFAFLRALVPTEMVNYGKLNPSQGTLEASTTCERSFWGEAVGGFGQHMKKYRYFNFDPTVNGGRPFFRSEFISDRMFRDTDIYSDCFRMLETMDHAAIYVPTDDGCLTWFSTERGGTQSYSERDRLMLACAQEHLVNARKLALARDLVRDSVKETERFDPGAFLAAGFTPREAEVAHWLTEGKTNVEIAALLRIQLQTVKGHVTALFNKTGIGNRLALTLHLMELGRQAPRAQRRAVRYQVGG